MRRELKNHNHSQSFYKVYICLNFNDSINRSVLHSMGYTSHLLRRHMTLLLKKISNWVGEKEENVLWTFNCSYSCSYQKLILPFETSTDLNKFLACQRMSFKMKPSCCCLIFFLLQSSSSNKMLKCQGSSFQKCIGS